MKKLPYKIHLLVQNAKKDSWKFSFVDAKDEKGTQIFIQTMDEFLEGVDVWMLDEDQNEMPVPDGVYEAPGMTLTIKNSKIEKLELTPDDAIIENAVVEENVVENEAEPEPAVEYLTKAEFDDFIAYIEELLGVMTTKIEALESQIGDFKVHFDAALKKTDAKFVDTKPGVSTNDSKTQKLFG